MRPPTTNQFGQITVEAVLIFSLIASLAIFGARLVKSQSWAAALVSSPWSMISGMVENGVWRDAREAKDHHPNKAVRQRRLSIKGDIENVP